MSEQTTTDPVLEAIKGQLKGWLVGQTEEMQDCVAREALRAALEESGADRAFIAGDGGWHLDRRQASKSLDRLLKAAGIAP